MLRWVQMALLAGGLLIVTTHSNVSAQAKKPADVGTLEITKDKAGQYRFKAVGVDGKTIMQSSKGYANKEDALKAIEAVREILSKGKVVEPKE